MEEHEEEMDQKKDKRQFEEGKLKNREGDEG